MGFEYAGVIVGLCWLRLSVALTTGCIDKSTPSTDCCYGEIELEPTLTSVGSSAFYECFGLTGSLTLPTGLTSIGSGAFYRCDGFTGSLTLPSGLTSELCVFWL